MIRHYTYDGNEMLAELDLNNQLLALYTQSGMRTDDTLSVQITSDGATQGLAVVSGSYQFMKDGLGSITSITNSSGDILQKYVYSGFGILAKVTDVNDLDITNNPTLNPYFTFANREFDQESGLYFLRARYYDSSTGRFLQEDPDQGNLYRPLTKINKFIYVLNNPLTFTDPSGKRPVYDVSDYCGPTAYGQDEYGNQQPVTNDLDRACEKHDNAYATASKWTNLNWDDSYARVETDFRLQREGLKRIPHQPLKGTAVFVFGSIMQGYSLSLFALSVPYTIIKGILKGIF